MVVGEVQLPEVDKTPGNDRGEGHQAVGRKIQLCDLAGDVDEPVQIHPGQLEVGPFHTKSLGVGEMGKAHASDEPKAHADLE